MPTNKESFSQQVKRELAKNQYSATELKWLLAALLKQRAELVIENGLNSLEVRLKSSASLQLVYSGLKKFYGPAMKTGAGDSIGEGGYRIYQLLILSKVDLILKDMHLHRDIPPKQPLHLKRAQRAYLVGSFLGSGFVSDPSASTPNFEISCASDAMAKLLLELLASQGFQLRLRQRRGYHVCYLKRADRIADLLKMLNAPESTLAFEDARISRDLAWQLSKLNNIDIANQQKAIAAAQQLIADINQLKKANKITAMPTKFSLFCRLRASRPNDTLAGIAKEMTKRGFPVSKAGLNHLSRQIRAMALEQKELKINI